MNELSGGEALVRMLELHGVRHIFGLCGDPSLPLYDALYRLDHGTSHILTRDERSAAYMADASARVTGRVGVCEGPSGGGATCILPGVVEANESIVRLGLPITMVVVANATFGWIKAGQRSGFGARYFAVDFSPGQHARVAEAYGLKTGRVEEPAELQPSLAAALEAGGPTLVDVVTQPLHEARAPVSEWVA